MATTLTCQESPRYIHDLNLLKIFGDMHFFSHSLVYFCHMVFVSSSCTFTRAFTCHLDRRQRGKNICGCCHLDGGPPSLPEDNGRWLRVREGETSSRDFVEMKKEHWIANREPNDLRLVHERIQIWWQLEILLLRICVIRLWPNVYFILLFLFCLGF